MSVFNARTLFFNAKTLWFQTTIIIGRDDVLDHDFIFSDNNVIN